MMVEYLFDLGCRVELSPGFGLHFMFRFNLRASESLSLAIWLPSLGRRLVGSFDPRIGPGQESSGHGTFQRANGLRTGMKFESRTLSMKPTPGFNAKYI